MKKALFLSLAAGLATALPLMADTDIYITGSTAFRANVHDACLKLFSPAPTEFTGTVATGGDTKTGNSAAQWTMTGTPIAGLTQISGTLTVHALFTGSVQGIQTVENGTKLDFMDKTGVEITHTPTIAFSDASSLSTTFPVDQINFNEENVAVQPFVMCKAVPAGNDLTNVTGINWEQLRSGINYGRIPVSAWTTKPSDHSRYIHFLQRTKDSGTRRCELAQEGVAYNGTVYVYNWDATNSVFYHATGTTAGTFGGTGIGIVGAAGNGNANLNWGQGYVGGGDIRTALGYNAASNTAVSYLSLADAKAISGSAAANNWTQVLPFDGIWPTAAGAGIAGNTGTNDFSPICEGVYPCWGYEVVVYPISATGLNISSANDQDVTLAQLGDQNTAGTFLGVLDSQALAPATPGSLVNEIVNSQPTGATAIPIGIMQSSRTSVGGFITP
jgi:hypothetical protein